MDFASLIQMLVQTAQGVLIYGGPFLVVLGVLVFVHEWGHYIVARMCGVRVVTFSIGFGKEIYGFNDKAGTRWKISLIPLGGYVQLYGDTDPASAGHSDAVEDDDGKQREMTDEEREVAFFNKPIWKRAAVVFAGPAINYIFAILLLAGLYTTQGQPVSPPTAAGIVGGSSADDYGFMPHDYVLSIDGKSIEDFGDIRREMMVALDQEKDFRIRRDGEIINILAKPTRVPREDRFGFKSTVGVLGLLPAGQGLYIRDIISIDGVEYTEPSDVIAEINRRMDTTYRVTFKQGEKSAEFIISPTITMNEKIMENGFDDAVLYLSELPPKKFAPHTLMTATQAAIKESYNITVSSLEAIWQMVVGVRSTTELGGIIRIGAIAGDMAQQGIVPIILLTALLSINLGFINLLPIPMLDGGHLVFYGVESVIGRPVSEQVQEYAFRAGFVFLIGIMAFANINDLYQLFT